MPLVRLTPRQDSPRPIDPSDRLKGLLIKEAGMDGSDADASVRRLMKGKFVDICFDEGEDTAAKAFLSKVAAFGLDAKLYQDEPLSWTGSRPRPLFLKLSGAVLVGFVIWLWIFFEHGTHTTIYKVVSIVEGLIVVCWLLSSSGGILDRRPQTDAQSEWHQNLSFWWRSGVFAAILLIGFIVREPWYAFVLLMVVLGGIGCAFLIRVMNRD